MRQHDSHESYEVWAGRLHWIAAIIVVSLGATVWLMYLLAHTWLAPLPGAPRMPPPVAPRLQANPHAELEAVRKRESAALEEYRWIDPQRGIARIPIERAMELMAQAAGPQAASPSSARPQGARPQAASPQAAGPSSASPQAAGPQAAGPQAASVATRPHVQTPADLNRRVGFDQHLGATLPKGTTFHDTDGSAVTLERLADGRPLLVALGYYSCPNLCDTELHGIGRTIASLPIQPGTDFQVAFVSIDPHEKPELAAAAARTLAHDLPSAGIPRWHFLTGDEKDISSLAAVLGYRYQFDPRLGQYAHPAGLVVTTAGTQVAQYFFGVSFPPEALRLALVGASHGRLGTVIDQLVLLCCGYDPSTGRYSPLIGRVTMGVCGLFLVVAGVWLWATVRRRAPA